MTCKDVMLNTIEFMSWLTIISNGVNVFTLDSDREWWSANQGDMNNMVTFIHIDRSCDDGTKNTSNDLIAMSLTDVWWKT